MPYLINHQALEGLKKTIEQAKEKKKRSAGAFCTRCGTAVKSGDIFCPQCGNRITADNAPDMLMIWADNMTEAADIAESQNPHGKWSYWDEPQNFCNDIDDLRRFCQKEDKRLAGTGIFVQYYVSEKGSVCHILEDEDNGGHFLEWLFFAQGDIAEYLPQSPDDRRIPG